MKVCEKCGDEIGGKDGVDNLCTPCEKRGKANKAAVKRRKAIDSVMRDHGMVKVRGALGGTYYE